jgi:uncharacterized protein
MLARLPLIPKDMKFFELFNRRAQNNLEGARLLLDLLNGEGDIEHKAHRLKAIEHAGDEITGEVFLALNRSFVTPLDREDISRLASALDDVIDWIEEPARRIRIYRLKEITPKARQFGQVILDQAQLIAEAVPLLANWKDPDKLEHATREIHRLENEGDDLLVEALADLYNGVTEVPQLINAMRWGDVYQLLEDATDRAEHVAVALHNIVLKHG